MTSTYVIVVSSTHNLAVRQQRHGASGGVLRLLLVERGVDCTQAFTRDPSVQRKLPAASNLPVHGFQRRWAAITPLGALGV
jgi:hypothetical protein